jgi:hypothetical protein
MTAAIDVEEVLSKLDIVEKISLLSGTHDHPRVLGQHITPYFLLLANDW